LENDDNNHFSTLSGMPFKPDFLVASILISKLSSYPKISSSSLDSSILALGIEYYEKPIFIEMSRDFEL
jgi:hypothetical protein